MKPELVIGLVGPIGCNIEIVEKAIAAALKQVDYKVRHIRVSEGIAYLLEAVKGSRPSLNTLAAKIASGNDVRRLFSKNGILAVYTIIKIRENRAEIAKEDDVQHNRSSASTKILQAQEIAKLEEVRQGSVAYIVR